MKFAASRADLLGALTSAARAGSEATLAAGDDEITITATDRHRWEVRRVDARVDEPGVVALPPGDLSPWLKMMRGDDVSVSGDSRLSFQCGTASLVRAVQSAETVPPLPVGDTEPLPLDGAMLWRNAARVEGHVSNDPTVPYLACVWFIHHMGQTLAVASDGVSLAILNMGDTEPFEPALGVPATALRLVDAESGAAIERSDRLFRAGNVTALLSETDEPKMLRSIVSAAPSREWTLTCDSSELARALDIVQIASRQDVKAGNVVELRLSSDGVLVSGSRDNASSTETVAASWTGPERVWTVSGPRLKKCLASVSSAEVNVSGEEITDNMACSIWAEDSVVECRLARLRAMEIPEND